jgi:serine/threonine protein kinase
VQSIIRRFVTEWEQGREPRIEDYVAGTGTCRTALLAELVAMDLKHRLKMGRDHKVELYLMRYPELGDEEAAGLIVRDYELRRRCGKTVVPTDYLHRFPRLKPILSRRFSSMQPPETDRPRTNTESLLPAPDDGVTVTPLLTPSDLSVPGVGPTSLFEAKFEWIEKVGQGGMGEVWRVRHRDLNEDRAVKFILPRHAHVDELRERLRREAQAMARVDHPHAVTVHDVCMEGVPYIEMEYLRGQPLNKVLGPKVPLPLEQTAQILKQLCDVLQSAHDRGIIHRDLKPVNLMLLDTGSPEEVYLKVLDFGVAKFLEPAVEITEPGLRLGTPVYMSPEQLESASNVDPRADLYSVGVILYELLTGYRPFTSSGPRLYYEILHTPAPPFRERNPNVQVAPAIEKLVLRCLEKDRSQRPASARELAEEFLRLAAPEIEDQHETVVENPTIDRRWILSAVAGLGLGGVALAWWFHPTDVGSTQRFSPPVAFLPPNWVRGRPPEDSDLVEVNGKNYPKVIERVVPGVKHPVVALLVRKPRIGLPDPFYIMRDKVWIELFEAFANDKPGKVRESQWTKDPDPLWPVRNVTGMEAQAFAEWLGGPGQGFLPTCGQWDQAAGKSEKDRALYPFRGKFDPNDRTGTAIAVGYLEAPRPVGTARLDRSPYGCRDMCGNGWEWTRLPDGASFVDLRAETYKAPEPFDFEKTKPDSLQSWEFDKRNPEIGFRVIMELEPVGPN